MQNPSARRWRDYSFPSSQSVLTRSTSASIGSSKSGTTRLPVSILLTAHLSQLKTGQLQLRRQLFL